MSSMTPGTAPRADPPLADEPHQSENSLGVGASEIEPNVKELKERVRKLEAIVSSSSNFAHSLAVTGSGIPVTNIPKLHGSHEKTRFFGMSHWMNAFDQV